MIHAGISVKDITPKTPQYLSGYVMRKEKSKSIHEDLVVTAFTVKNNNTQLFLISLDTIIIDMEMADMLRKQIALKHHIDKNNVSIGALHTHSAPNLFDGDHFGAADETYQNYVFQQICAAADEAAEVLKPVNNIEYRSGKIDGYYSNRNNKSIEGDKWVHIVTFFHTSTAIASIMNFSCHGTVLGPENYAVSADLPGELRRRYVEATGITPILFNGNSGDMSNRQYRKGNDLQELSRVGKEISNQILQLPIVKEINCDDIEIECLHYEIRYRIDKDDLREKVTLNKKKLEEETNYDKRKLLKSAISFLNNRMNSKKEEVYIPLDTILYKLGDMSIVTIPGELFSDLGLIIKKRSPFSPTLLFGYTNGFVGYLVSEKQFNDSYESMTTEIPKGAPETYVEEIIKLLNK